MSEEVSNLLQKDSKYRNGYSYGSQATNLKNDNAAVDSTVESHSLLNSENNTDSWLIPFFINIFLACASFSIVIPSLAPYILEIGGDISFLPWVVSSYSIGEMFGSVAFGHFYEYATTNFEILGRGPRMSMQISLFLGIWGSALYAVAGWLGNDVLAQYCILVARFIQGLWTGGQQAIEQAYLSAAVEPSKRVEYTATLSTCAVLGFVTGPTIGAVLSQIDTTVFGLPINAYNAPGIFIFLCTVIMSIQSWLFFDGKDDLTGYAPSPDEDVSELGDSKHSASSEGNNCERPFNHNGVAMSIIVFFVHYYSFAVQETITTPMVIVIYNWSPLQINLLFACAGIMSLITSFSVRYLTRYVKDRTMLVSSILIGFIGSILLVDGPFVEMLPLWRFLLGFIFITVAFPVGRNVVLGVFGNVLGPVNQGRWMGAIIAVSAIPRVLGPFLALEALEFVQWQTWLEFGICATLFGITLLGTIQNLDALVPYSDFMKRQTENGAETNPLLNSHSPVPSPMLGRSPSNSLRKENLKNWK